MNTVALLAVLLVAALHAYFMVLEMVLWTKPFGRKAFGLTSEFAEATKGLAANQGLYNGFLVAGLLWSVVAGLATPMGFAVATFFLICVVVAGGFGGITVNRKILWVQALPGAIALILVWLAR